MQYDSVCVYMYMYVCSYTHPHVYAHVSLSTYTHKWGVADPEWLTSNANYDYLWVMDHRTYNFFPFAYT